MKSFILGLSRLKLPIIGYEFGNQGAKILILGGVHGDEKEGVVASMGLVNTLALGPIPHLQITIIPQFNIEGVLKNQRQNSEGVDLNRNLPTIDWTKETENPRYFPGLHSNSEPENQALTSWLKEHPPHLIVSLHSWKPLLNINGDCLNFTQYIAKRTGYEIQESIGYPTPGCLGTYCGLERHIPTLTYEIERGLSYDSVMNIHVPAIIDALKLYKKI